MFVVYTTLFVLSTTDCFAKGANIVGRSRSSSVLSIKLLIRSVSDLLNLPMKGLLAK